MAPVNLLIDCTSVLARLSDTSSMFAMGKTFSQSSPVSTISSQSDVDVSSLSPAVSSVSGGMAAATTAPLPFGGGYLAQEAPAALRANSYPTSKRYLCQRCLNHGDRWARKGHKPFCRYANCDCDRCVMVDERRRLNNAICQRSSTGDDENDDDESRNSSSTDKSKVRDPKCARCSAHGEASRLRGHKKRCPHADCVCELCKLVEERRGLMAKQIKLRRDQKAKLQKDAYECLFAVEQQRQQQQQLRIDEQLYQHNQQQLLLSLARQYGQREYPSTTPLVLPTTTPVSRTAAPMTSSLTEEHRHSSPPYLPVYVPVRIDNGGGGCHHNEQCTRCLQDDLDRELKIADFFRTIASLPPRISAPPSPHTVSTALSPMSQVTRPSLGGLRLPISNVLPPPSTASVGGTCLPFGIGYEMVYR